MFVDGSSTSLGDLRLPLLAYLDGGYLASFLPVDLIARARRGGRIE
jgi:hypothetical protein